MKPSKSIIKAGRGIPMMLPQEDNPFEVRNDKFSISTKAMNLLCYNVYLNGDIGYPHEYTELLDLFRSVPERSLIRFYINSGGGQVNTAMTIINAMNECRGDIVTILDGEAHSAAGYIFLAGHEFVVNPNASMLCHTYSGGSFGKGPDVRKQVDFNYSLVNDYMVTVYSGFLTEAELKSMESGEDFWFKAEDIVERLNNKVSRKVEDLEIPLPEIVSYPSTDAAEIEKIKIEQELAMELAIEEEVKARLKKIKKDKKSDKKEDKKEKEDKKKNESK